jgi:hypothetical protein
VSANALLKIPFHSEDLLSISDHCTRVLGYFSSPEVQHLLKAQRLGRLPDSVKESLAELREKTASQKSITGWREVMRRGVQAVLEFQEGAMLSLFMDLLATELEPCDLEIKLDICGVLINVAAGNKDQTEMLVFRTTAIRDFLDFVGQVAVQDDDYRQFTYAGAAVPSPFKLTKCLFFRQAALVSGQCGGHE